MDELLDLISKEEYLENEEKIQKALERSKEEREQRKQEKSQIKAAETDADKEVLDKADDEKHILDAEKTPTFESAVSLFASILNFFVFFMIVSNRISFSFQQSEENLGKKISDLDLSKKSTTTPKKPNV